MYVQDFWKTEEGILTQTGGQSRLPRLCGLSLEGQVGVHGVGVRGKVQHEQVLEMDGEP